MDSADEGFSQLQRELGVAAAQSEEGRRTAEHLLQLERQRAAELEQDKAALAAQLAEAQAAASASGARAAAAEAEALALRQELSQLRSQLSWAEDHGSAKLEQLRRQLAEAKTSAAESSGRTGQAETENDEAGKLRREVNGLKGLVSFLQKKVDVYEVRLLQQAASCAEELNKLREDRLPGGSSTAEGTCESLSDFEAEQDFGNNNNSSSNNNNNHNNEADASERYAAAPVLKWSLMTGWTRQEDSRQALSWDNGDVGSGYAQMSGDGESLGRGGVGRPRPPSGSSNSTSNRGFADGNFSMGSEHLSSAKAPVGYQPPKSSDAS
ncbi:unnamed protein product [Polarella glacialis]|uniref:Uncharacterized protein n=1 Tax=Polarella glacialis TaxID=89957 RepID=A0A813KJ66_POLGL|nr:unnamed protein product [Polarella glacialis]CAE8704964.1 unnamed protein product [Polarella glacialis]